jgi:hypothetical protein
MNGTQVYQDEVLNSLVNPNWRNESIESAQKEAFKEGYKKGQTANEIALKDFFLTNIESAIKFSERLYKDLQRMNFGCKHMMLKSKDLSSFELLCIVEEKSFLSATRKEVYKLIRQYKKEINSRKFFIECLIMPNTGEIDFNLINSDGYQLRYEPKAR